MDSERGFSLLELMIVLVIVAIIAGFAASGGREREWSVKRRQAKICLLTASLADRRERTPKVPPVAFAWPACTVHLSNYYTFERVMESGSYALYARPVDASRKYCYNFRVLANGDLAAFDIPVGGCRID